MIKKISQLRKWVLYNEKNRKNNPTETQQCNLLVEQQKQLIKELSNFPQEKIESLEKEIKEKELLLDKQNELEQYEEKQLLLKELVEIT